MKRSVAVLLVRLVVGGAFVWAGALKARAPAEFIRDIWNYHLVPEAWSYWIAAFVPYLEIAAGAALVTGFQRRGAHLVLALLLVTFAIFLASAWARGLDITCGCFGGTATSSPLRYAWWITRDLLLLAGVGCSARAARASAQLQ